MTSSPHQAQRKTGDAMNARRRSAVALGKWGSDHSETLSLAPPIIRRRRTFPGGATRRPLLPPSAWGVVGDFLIQLESSDPDSDEARQSFASRVASSVLHGQYSDRGDVLCRTNVVQDRTQ